MDHIFEYPLDVPYLTRKKRSLKKQLLQQEDLISKKIAILGGSTTAEIKDMLEIFLLKEGIRPEFYETDYNRYYEEIMFSQELRIFKPDIIYIHTTVRNIEEFPLLTETQEEIINRLNNEFSKYEMMWKVAIEELNAVVIQNNFEYPLHRILGNQESVLAQGKINYINKLNEKFNEYARKNSALNLCDINYLAALVGLNNWHDLNMWYSYKYALSQVGVVNLAKSISNIIKAILGKTKKCLVLDLDNTLWGGVIGDDGVEGIKIGRETAISEAYLGFQHYIKELKIRGITLAIASKNDYDNAILGLKHPEMLLNEKDFTNIKANWDEKSNNLLKIAEEINIGLDSLVFIDDNPAERDIVSQMVPAVSVPNIGTNVLDYINHIDMNGYFEAVSISEDDMKRNTYYEQNNKRSAAQHSFTNYTDFLKSLDMQADVAEFKAVYLDRITQLINKTNQFNLTTNRYTSTEVNEMFENDTYITLYARLKDKFGDNGLVSVVIGQKQEEALHINIWLMSCRVLKRDLEYLIFDELVTKAKQAGLTKIIGYYKQTAKNSMVKDHYKQLGFDCIQEDEVCSTWVFDLTKTYKALNQVIRKGEY